MAHNQPREQSGPRLLLAGVSFGAMLLGLTASPASAQLAQMRGAAGTLATPSAGTVAAAAPVVPVTMREAMARQQALQSRAQVLAKYVQSAQSAAVASIPGPPPTDGISARGLYPIAAVRAATLYVAAGTDPGKVTPNAAPSSVAAANDATGRNTWEGATAPVQSTDSAGKVTVTINQTQKNALLSWQNFDISANTSLVFNQKSNGVAQPGWTVVNRVVDAVNPSKIFGSITADGTVLILNSHGVLFAPNSQVNLHSLIASSLELGNFASSIKFSGSSQYFVASTIKDRNTAFLQNGLLVSGVNGFKGQLLSAELAPGQYDVTSSLPLPTQLQGEISVYTGAKITAGSGGFIILAGPTVTNAGVLTAADGQVSLQGGEFIGATPSTGAANSADPYVRGLVLSTQIPSIPVAPHSPTPDQGTVVNYGVITSRRGYISLGSGIYGSVENQGLLQATTSVSRNGKITLTGGTVELAGGAADLAHLADAPGGRLASGIVILNDDATLPYDDAPYHGNGETIPQGTPDSPPAFKTSQITIGDAATLYSATGSGDIALLPSLVHMGQNAFILAPSANVVIGQDASKGTFALQAGVPSGVTIDSGATIDVAGLAAVTLDASVNSVTISPAKKNELRDTPNYRSVTTDGSFTLNGETLYVDARASGVRSDGVVWAGSPLLEAGSAISQIPATAAQLMTKGGTISIDVGAQIGQSNLDPAAVPSITINKGAIFDVSGGWVHYNAGVVISTELITSDGLAVNIAKADPNGDYVALVNGFTASQPHFGISETYYNAALAGQHFDAAYDEGRDAGALEVVGSQIAFRGAIYGNAFAGANQLALAQAASAGSSLGGDPRKLQYSKYQLPSGALFRIGSFSGKSGIGLGQDILVYDSKNTSPVDTPVAIGLDANMLSAAGLSGLMLQTSGGVTIASAANLTLADGGTLAIDAGRAISLDGNVRIADGTIQARTYLLSNLLAPGMSTVGNLFRSDDDIDISPAQDSILPRPFDITVNGTLDVSGRWTNDYLNGDNPQGAGWINGGSISLTVAPKAFVALVGSDGKARVSGDLSGSLIIKKGALLDVSAGGYLSPKRGFKLSATGGSVSLINQTTYSTVVPVVADTVDQAGTTVAGQGVAFTPVNPSDTAVGVSPSLVPLVQNSFRSVCSGTIRGFGFGGGGTFKLVAPLIDMSGAADAQIPLDFLQRTGFGTLDLTAYHSRIVRNLFDNGSAGLSSFFDTTRVVVGDGVSGHQQSLNLTQVLLPNNLDTATQAMLLALPSGSKVASLLTAVVPTSAWYQKAATLNCAG